MSARLALILALLSIGIALYGGAFVGYRYYRKHTAEWTLETDKLKRMSWLELITRGGVLLAAVGLIRYFMKDGDTFISILSLLLVMLVIVLYSLIKRGHPIAVLMFVILSALYFFLITMFIGLPQKAPVFTINNTEITMAHTTAGDLIKDGFDIYVKETHEPNLNYKKSISSDGFKKYPADRSIHVKKGFQINYAPYPLVKDNVVIGYVGLYGEENKNIVLEDCKIIRIVLTEKSLTSIREKSMSCKLNEIDLLAPLKPEEMKKTFGNKLWLVPNNPTDITEMHYGIRWPAPGHSLDYLFWDHYYSLINFNENNRMIKFEISTNIARDLSF